MSFKKSEYCRTFLFGLRGSKSIIQEKQIPTAYVSVIMVGLCYAKKTGEFFLSRQKGAERLCASVNTIREGIAVARKLGIITQIQKGDNTDAAVYRFCEVATPEKSGKYVLNRYVPLEWDKSPHVHIAIKGMNSLNKMVECESMYIGQQNCESCKSYFDLSHAETNIWTCMLFGSNRDTGLIRISHSELAEKSNLSTRTVFRSIDALVEKQLLERIDNESGRVATYMVLSAWDEMNGLTGDYEEPELTEQELKREEAEDALGMVLCPFVDEEPLDIRILEASVDSVTAAAMIAARDKSGREHSS